MNRLYDCSGGKVFSAQDTDAPAPIAAIFARGQDKLQFRVCSDGEKNTHYFVRTPPSQTPGVCRTNQTQIYPGAETDSIWVGAFQLKGWRLDPPADWKAVGYENGWVALGGTQALAIEGDCPAQFDSRYVPANNVSDGLLKSFDQLWRRASSSAEEFNRIFPRFTPKNAGENWFVPIHARWLGVLRMQLVEQHMPYSSISCDNSCSAQVDKWIVHFDVVDGRLVILGFGLPPVG